MNKVVWMKIAAIIVALGLSGYAILGMVFVNLGAMMWISRWDFQHIEWDSAMLVIFGNILWIQFFLMLRPWIKEEPLKYPWYVYTGLFVLTFAHKFFMMALFALPVIVLYFTIVIGNYIDYEQKRE